MGRRELTGDLLVQRVHETLRQHGSPPLTRSARGPDRALLVPARLRWAHEVEVLSLAPALHDVPGRAGSSRQGDAGSGRRRSFRAAPRRNASCRRVSSMRFRGLTAGSCATGDFSERLTPWRRSRMVILVVDDAGLVSRLHDATEPFLSAALALVTGVVRRNGHRPPPDRMGRPRNQAHGPAAPGPPDPRRPHVEPGLALALTKGESRGGWWRSRHAAPRAPCPSQTTPGGRITGSTSALDRPPAPVAPAPHRR